MAAKFTFFGKGDRVEVRFVDLESHSPANENNAVSLDSTITVQAGAFAGSFNASFTPDDLVSLHEQLKQALTSLSEEVSFQNTEGGLALSISLDSGGTTSITGVAHPNRLREGMLLFRIDTDHIALIDTLCELEDALRAFPSTQTKYQEQFWS